MMTSQADKIRGAAKLIALLLVIATTLTAHAAEGSAEAGIQISSRAEATYSDDAGTRYTIVSATVTVTVLAVATVVVTPDETAPSQTVAPHDQVTSLFRVCNTGNTVDTFSITQFDLTAPATLSALYFDNDASASVSDGDAAIVLTQTASPQLPPRGCIGVLASINTNDVVARSNLTFTLTARSNATNAANGRGQDSGTIIVGAGLGPRLTHPDNPDLPPLSLIDGKTQPVLNLGSTFTASIAFKNSGDTAVRDVVITQELSPGIEYLPDSIQMGTLKTSPTVGEAQPSETSRNVIIRLPRVDPGDVVRFSFRLRITGSFPAGSGVVSGAVITGANMLPVKTSTATIVINPFGLVFAGRGGSATPIAGARLEIATDQSNESLLALPSDKGFAPNEKNENPFVSDTQGHFSFVLGANALSDTASANYFMKASANGYMDRLMQLSLRPTRSGLFSVTVHALDNQPFMQMWASRILRPWC